MFKLNKKKQSVGGVCQPEANRRQSQAVESEHEHVHEAESTVGQSTREL